MKRIIGLITIGCLVLSCSDSVDFTNPKSVVKHYNTLVFSGEFEPAYQYLADTCHAYATLQDYLDFNHLKDSILNLYDCSVEKVNQMTIDPTNIKYRHFETTIIKINKKDQDTARFVVYTTVFNQKGVWKIIWVGNLLEAAGKLSQSQKWTDAIDANNAALKYDPLNGQAYHNIGWCQFRQKDDENALKSARKAVEHNPKEAKNYNLLAAVYKDQNNGELAINNLNRAIELTHSRPYKASLLGNLALNYMALNENNKAVTAITNALSMDSTSTHGWYVMGLIYLDAKEYDDAIGYFRKAATLEPMEDYIQQRLYFCLANAEYKKASYHTENMNERDMLLKDAKTNVLKALDLQPENKDYKYLLKKINSGNSSPRYNGLHLHRI